MTKTLAVNLDRFTSDRAYRRSILTVLATRPASDPAPAPLTALECGHVIDAEGRTVAQDSPDPLRALVLAALDSEDEIAHGEAWSEERGEGIGVCAYCDDKWPCRTQQGIDRLRAAIEEVSP